MGATKRIAIIAVVLGSLVSGLRADELKPVPDRLVVLTFDDSVKSHFTIVRPILKKYRFGATFFITEGFDFASNKNDYMTWEEIRSLERDGFEIGNHTRDHLSIAGDNVARVDEQLTPIDESCRRNGIAKPTSFAWPGNAFDEKALDELRQHGIVFARRGGSPEFDYREGRGFAYEPGRDHPLLIPSAGDARPDWHLEDFVAAVRQARDGKIAVLQFHGVPDREHHWVNTPKDRFEHYMRYLHEDNYQVIALRDLRQYVDPNETPNDPMEVIRERRKQLPGVREEE